MIARPEFYTLVGLAALVIVVVTGARRWREMRAARNELHRRVALLDEPTTRGDK